MFSERILPGESSDLDKAQAPFAENPPFAFARRGQRGHRDMGTGSSWHSLGSELGLEPRGLSRNTSAVPSFWAKTAGKLLLEAVLESGSRGF